MEKIRILQLSDIHWLDKPNLVDEYRDIRDALLEDIKNICESEENKFDRIFICGDIAFSGQAEEYKRADKFIKKLCGLAGNNKSTVSVVPGNHDKDFEYEHKTLREFFHNHLIDEKKPDDLWLKMLREEFALVKMLYEPFKDYGEFSFKYNSLEPAILNLSDQSKKEYKEEEYVPYWEDDIKQTLEGYKVKVYGFNSALMSDYSDWDDTNVRNNSHKMFLPQLAYHAGTERAGIINIMLCHHPLEYISDDAAIRKDLDKRYPVQLYGHVHKSVSNTKNNAVHIFSGSLQPGKSEATEYKPVYNIIELSVAKVSKGKDILNVSLNVFFWDGDDFQINQNESKNLCVELKSRMKTTKDLPMQIIDALPDGITKRDIRNMFIDTPCKNKIVDKLYFEFYRTDISEYKMNQLFLERVRQDDKWMSLYNELKK